MKNLKGNDKRNWNFKKTIYAFFKRIFGFTIALCGIILLLPIMIIIAIAINLIVKAPVIFKQNRTGKMVKYLRYGNLELCTWIMM